MMRKITEMESSDKVVSPSKVSISDENDQNCTYHPNCQKIDPHSQNIKKRMGNSYMSPIISAASKAINPRKNILAERNKAPESISPETQTVKNPNVDLKSRFQPDSKLLPNGDSEFDSNEENTFVADSSLQPYDPLTNYLSPRPKFLRYKPNRRKEIFLHRENGLSIGKSSSFDSTKIMDEDSLNLSSDSSSYEGSLKQEEEKESQERDEEEVDESDEELEEVKEDRGSIVKWMLKFLLSGLAIVLSTAYISTMNADNNPLFEFPFTGVSRDGSFRIQNMTNEAALLMKLQSGSAFRDKVEEAEKSLPVIHRGATADGIEEEKMVMKNDLENGIGNGNVEALEYADEFGEMAEELQHDESELIKTMEGDNNEAISEFVDEWVEMQDENDCDHLEASENHGTFQDDQKTPLISEEAVDVEKVETKTEEHTKIIEKEGEDLESEGLEHGLAEFDEMFNIKKEEENFKDRVFEQVSVSSEPVTVISMFLIFSILGGLALKSKRVRTIRKETVSIAQPCSESRTIENENIIKTDSFLIRKPSSDFVKFNQSKDHIEHVESFRKALDSIYSVEEMEAFQYSRAAPSVELLGEFEIEEVCSLKKSGMKNKMVESENSEYSVSLEERLLIGTQNSGPIHADTSLPEFSNSNSYGSFSAEKIRKKEVGSDGELNMVTTPVRRSTRIRNRTVMSP